MNTKEFIDKYNGKKIDWDGAYGGQCVDLFRQYVHEVLALSQPKSVTGAADFWTNYDSDPALKNNFDKIANSATFVPIEGDLMIWNKKAGGGFGHISVCTDKGDVNGFESFDQNWKTISVCELISHVYTNVYGVLRPKNQPPEASDLQKQLDEANFHKANLQEQVNGLLKDLEQYKGELSAEKEKNGTLTGRIQELTKQNEDLSGKLGQANSTNQALTAKVESQNIIIGEFTKEDAVQIKDLRDAQDKADSYSDKYLKVIRTMREMLKLSSTVTDEQQAESEAYNQLQSLIDSKVKQLNLSDYKVIIKLGNILIRR